MNPRHLLALVGLVTASCFRAPSPGLIEQAPPEALSVRDVEGAVFAPDQTPRDPTLLLAFEQPPSAELARSLLLLRGVVRPALLAHLATTRSGAALKARSVQVQTQALGASLQVTSSTSLTPGARYTLAWLADADDSIAFGFTVAAGPTAGARLVESWPSEGDVGVPADLTRVLLRFDGRLQGEVAAHVSLRDEQAQTIATSVQVEPCAARGLPAGDCVWLTPGTSLTPGGRYQLALTSGLRTLGGASVAPRELRFEVAAARSDTATALLATRCALDERAVLDLCLRIDARTLSLRGSTDRSVLLTLLSTTSRGVVSSATLSYANGFMLRHELSPDTRVATLRITELSGRTRELELDLQRELESTLPAVEIDEARPDPRGKEPAQEYVELLNSGPTPVSLMGFTLTTDVHARGRAITTQGVLAPGERVLVVAPDFDPRDGADPALPGGVRIVALDGALSLANSGDQLFLRDAAGRRLSSLRVLAPLVEGQCSARYPSALPELDDELSVELDPDGACTPGAATSFTP